MCVKDSCNSQANHSHQVYSCNSNFPPLHPNSTRHNQGAVLSLTMDISAASTTRDNQALNDNLPGQEILHRQELHDSHSHHANTMRLDSGVANVLLPSSWHIRMG